MLRIRLKIFTSLAAENVGRSWMRCSSAAYFLTLKNIDPRRGCFDQIVMWPVRMATTLSPSPPASFPHPF
ncbi:hypothetical protein EON64_01320 [archaeon]|nr:MAG: hypothetical protein EON64_01320 [archaeon]